MTELNRVSDETAELMDGYLADQLDEAQFRRLEQLLLADEAARNYFVRYCRLHTDLHMEVRARRATDRAIGKITGSAPGTTPANTGGTISPLRQRPWRIAMAAAAVIVLSVGVTWWVVQRAARGSDGAQVAWLANAQDCHWAHNAGPDAGLTPGRVLQLQSGLAEVRFRTGATVVLQGPASLQLISLNSARLLHGRLSARVPDAAKGFQILAPQGRVVDLGTEFGVVVGDDGTADVVVFKGKVEAYGPGTKATPLTENRTARISAAAVVVDPLDNRPTASSFTREILATTKYEPRTWRLDFHGPINGSLMDANGAGTGLLHRLPGTGSALPPNDPNLKLDAASGNLELTTTRSDINTQYRLGEGEYLGTRLSTLGFTGSEDFEVTATIPNIPSLAAVGQLGLYVGSKSDRNIRGGLISRGATANNYKQFLVNNDGGNDHDSAYIGIFPTGTDVQLTLRRQRGQFTLTVAGLNAGGAASTLSIRHPAFLDREGDLYVGLFGANTGSEERRALAVKELKVTVWAAANAPAP